MVHWHVEPDDLHGHHYRVTLRLPRPVTTRYVLVWLTEIPAEGGGFQGGIAEATVLG